MYSVGTALAVRTVPGSRRGQAMLNDCGIRKLNGFVLIVIPAMLATLTTEGGVAGSAI